MSGAVDARIGVLLVDDHKMFAQSLGRLLADESDFEVLGVVSDAADAVPMAAALEPDVVLVDYQMGGRDGLEVAAELTANQPWVRVIMLTGSQDERVLLAALEAGCSGLITKDRAASDVMAAVRAVAAGEAIVSAAVLTRLIPRLDRNFRERGADLTVRERQVLAAMVNGLSNAAIAEQMHLSVNTIRNYVQSILTKLDAHSKLEAVATGLREHIVDLPVAAG